MNVNQLIIDSLTSLNLPTVCGTYEGDATEYITFNYADERPAIYNDDVDELDETTVQVHYFTTANPQTNKKIIRRLLRAGGFSIQSTSDIDEIDDQGAMTHHVIIYAWIEGFIND